MKTLIKKEDFRKVLTEYQNAYAQVWLFNVTHQRLAIRLKNRMYHEVLYIVGVSCEHITTPFSWGNSDVSIEYTKDDSGIDITIVSDDRAGFKLLCRGVSLAIGPWGELDTSFENFLGEER